MYVCINIHKYVYVYIHTHAHIHTQRSKGGVKPKQAIKTCQKCDDLEITVAKVQAELSASRKRETDKDAKIAALERDLKVRATRVCVYVCTYVHTCM